MTGKPKPRSVREQYASAFATELERSGMTYRAFAAELRKELGRKIAHSAVQKWFELGRQPRHDDVDRAVQAVLGVRFVLVTEKRG